METESESGPRVFRNHPSVIVGNVLLLFFISFFIFLAMGDDSGLGYRTAFIGMGVLCLFGAFLFYYWWKRTTYLFTDTELNVKVDTMFKKDNHIQYAKLASVNVRRTIINHVFGTSTLTFNVNSSVNSSVPEASLCLKKELADRLRHDLNEMIFNKGMTVQEDLGISTEIKITNGDIIVHAIIGQPTYQAIFGLVMLIYSVVSLFTDNRGGFITAIVLFVFSVLVPFVSVILKYFNYRIYRVGDTITVESGLINNYRSSFKINKINSVRIYQPLAARMFGKAMLIGEVVGMAGEDGVPLLCPLKPKAQVEGLMSRIVPEFQCDSEGVHQPKVALIPMILVQAVLAALSVLVCYTVFGFAGTESEHMTPFARSVVNLIICALAVLVPVGLFGYVGLAQSSRSFATGDSTFMFIYGSYDLKQEYINYDKVQYVSVVSGPFQRMFGLATCRVSLMSSAGSKTIESGLFRPEDLELVGNTVMSRIEDGSYDYRRYY